MILDSNECYIFSKLFQIRLTLSREGSVIKVAGYKMINWDVTPSRSKDFSLHSYNVHSPWG
jgi:hypothetical protein